MRLRIICQGKTKDEHLRALQEDYIARIGHFASIEVEEIRPAPEGRARGALTAAERRMLEKAGDARHVTLDPRGQDWTSTEFARWMAANAAAGTRETAFLIGGADGFSEAFRREAGLMLSLSRMTLTRDWARTLLLEQIYRSFTIARGYPYSR